jgi:hypothetical protein
MMGNINKDGKKDCMGGTRGGGGADIKGKGQGGEPQRTLYT